MKSKSVGLTQCFITVESDQDYFRLGGGFCTEVLTSEALLRSDLNLFRNSYDVITVVHPKWWKRAEFV